MRVCSCFPPGVMFSAFHVSRCSLGVLADLRNLLRWIMLCGGERRGFGCNKVIPPPHTHTHKQRKERKDKKEKKGSRPSMSKPPVSQEPMRPPVTRTTSCWQPRVPCFSLRIRSQGMRGLTANGLAACSLRQCRARISIRSWDTTLHTTSCHAFLGTFLNLSYVPKRSGCLRAWFALGV